MEGNVRKSYEETENTAKAATCWQALQRGIKPGSLNQCFSFSLDFVVEKVVSSTA